jgi:4-aminobutyrate aminotransferase-like enzyme
MEAWRTPGECLHATTFLANPLACAASLAALEVMKEEGLPARAAELGAMVEASLRGLRRRIREDLCDPGAAEVIVDVRGRGLLWGIEANGAELAARWSHECLQRGVLILAGGPVMRLDPPLTITEQQLEMALSILEVSLRAAVGRGGV